MAPELPDRGTLGTPEPAESTLKLPRGVCGVIWFRATWPRFGYDQLMNVGCKRLIPLGMAAVLVNAVVGMLKG